MNQKLQKEHLRTVNFALLLVLIVVAILPYIPSLHGDFVLDDNPLIVKDTQVHSLSNIPGLFHRDFLHGTLGCEYPIYYRPLITISFALNYAASGSHPFAFRLTNLIAHLLVVLLVAYLGKRLSGSSIVGIVAGLAFAVLPSHAESVAWISGRTDVIATLFTLASFAVFYTNTERKAGFSWGLALLFSLLFACALFSKESGILVPLLCLSYLWAFRKLVIWKDVWRWVAVTLPVLVVYLIFRQHVVGSSIQHMLMLSLGKRLFCIGIAYAAYLRMLFIPQELRVLYDVFPIGIKYPIIAISAWALPLGLLGTAIYVRKRIPALAFALLWILITLLPVTNIIPTIGPVPAERFVYLASIGSSIVIGWIALKMLRAQPNALRIWNVIAIILISFFILYSGALTLQSSRYYESDANWARGIAATNSRFARMRIDAGMYLFKAGYMKEASDELEKGIALVGPRRENVEDDTSPSDFIALAVAKRSLGLYKDALEVLQQAEVRFGAKSTICYHLGVTLACSGDIEKAADAFRRSTELDPKLGPAWRNLGRAQLKLRHYQEAVAAYEHLQAIGQLTKKDQFNLEKAVAELK